MEPFFVAAGPIMIRHMAPQIAVHAASDWDQPLRSVSACLAALQEGAHTTWALPTSFRVVMAVRIRWVPHKKQDIVEEMELVPLTKKGEPPTLDL